MRCQISPLHIKLTEALKYHILACQEILLLHFAGRISALKVRLYPVTHPKVGGDKICRLLAGIDQHSCIDAEGRDADLYLAITQAFVRMHRSLASLLEMAHDPNPRLCHDQGAGPYTIEADGPYSHSVH